MINLLYCVHPISAFHIGFGICMIPAAAWFILEVMEGV